MKQIPTILEQFRSFYAQNSFDDIQQAIEYFTVFGGLNDPIDKNKDISELIQINILDKYNNLNNMVCNITQGDGFYHSLLSAIATGDGRFHSVYKKARTTQDEAEDCLDELCETGVVNVEDDLNFYSDKLYFTTPFMKFWFAFVSPLYKDIKESNYEEVFKRFENKKQEFIQDVFIQLSKELIKLNFANDPIEDIQSYWDKGIDIDIIATTSSSNVIAANCKYINSKMKKSELTRLKQDCQKSHIDANIFILCCKNGFSSELKALKSKHLGLISLKSFKKLVNNIDKKEICNARLF
jgi:AAA+ ATPase superfamily predicted ATPase